MRLLALVTFVIFSLLAPTQAATVKVTVNNVQITDVQITARASLMRVERRGNSNSGRLKLATEELIDEQIKLSEAARLGITVGNAQVDEAYLNVARGLKLNTTKLNELLFGSGVNPQTLKDRLRAGLAWQGISQGAISSRVSVSDLDLEQQAREKLSAATSYDYILKEVRFIIPAGSKGSTSRRTAQANQYRKSFQGCDTAVELSLSYTDAAVLDIGRRHGTQLPDAIAKELAGLNAGGITKPRVANGGVSMLAVCSKSAAEDTSFIKSKIRQEVGTEKLQSEATAYLKNLRDKAAIVYR